MGMNYYLKHKDENKKFVIPSSLFSNSSGRLVVQSYNQNQREIALDLNNCVEVLEKLHIGKSSFGWHFSLCIYPELNIYNLDDWKSLFSSNDYVILNEEDDEISEKEMLSVITDRKSKKYEECKSTKEFEKSVVDSYNKLEKKMGDNPRLVKSYDEYLALNHASRGKNGLLSHQTIILDLRDDKRWEGFLPVISRFIQTDGTYDLTLDWDFS